MTQNRMKFGFDKLDEFLGGGIPYGSDILLKNTVGTPKEAFLHSYLFQGLNEGSSCWVLSTVGYLQDYLDENEIGDYVEKGRLIFIDAFSNPYNTKDVKPHSKYAVRDIKNMHHVKRTIREATEEMKPKHSRGVIDSFTHILKIAETHTKHRWDKPGILTEDILDYIGNQRALLREFEASLVYTINPHAHSRPLLSSLEDIMSGVISLNRAKTNGEFKNTLTIEKLARSNFSSKKHTFTIKEGKLIFEKD